MGQNLNQFINVNPLAISTQNVSVLTENSSLNTKLLRIGCLNCCGIKTRLQYPEFKNFIQNYEIVCFVETKTDDIDIIDFPGYNFHMKNRKKISNRRSGGITVGIKDTLKDFIEIVNTDSRYVLWFKCKESLFKTDQPVFFGVVYIPPEYSKYSSEDAFTEIEREFISFSDRSKFMCLLGDFNARTANENDFVSVQQNEHEENDISEFLDDYTSCLYDMNMSICRKSMDECKNRYGNILLDFCKGNNMFILNGRAGNDKNTGKFTCRNASVVDYCIASPDLLKLLSEFDILESSKLFSDVHSPLHVVFTADGIVCDENNKNLAPNLNKIKIKPWNNEQIDEFKNNINEEKLFELEQTLTNYCNDIGSVDNSSVDFLVNELGNIFTNSASKAFGTCPVKSSYGSEKNRNDKNDKPWFDRECRAARQNFRKYKRLYKLNNSFQNRSNMTHAEKNYKKMMDEKYKKYIQKLSNDINDASKKDPKEFWKFFKGHKRKKQPNIETDVLYKFFKNLNCANSDEGNVFDLENPTINANESINRYISKDEILKCIKKFEK